MANTAEIAYTLSFGSIREENNHDNMKAGFSVAANYKETMNLPRTDFSMKANLAQNEPKRLEQWEAADIYHKVLEKNKDGEPFVLHDGPPYANGPIHIGHAFNKILKDFVVKSHAQRGYFTPYIPGWDCHGQPIEHMVEVTLGPEKMAAIDQPTLRRLCREWAEKYVDVQRNGFKRLGVNADWEHPYLTFTPDYEAGNVEVFKTMYLDGSIYRGRKPIHWCKHCHTALAEAEIEYGDEVSPSIYVKFLMDEMPAAYASAGAEGEAWILIWTTTPWTLPANGGVALAPDADYVMVDAEGGQTAAQHLIVARELVDEVAKVAGWTGYRLIGANGAVDVADGQTIAALQGEPVVIKGRDFAGMTYTCPVIRERKGKFIYADYVALDTGTGAVHIAPGHGQEDYIAGLEFDIPILMPVDDDGRFTKDAGRFAGLDVEEANPQIIEWLRGEGTLIAAVDITHSYPHCWRCHEPVIFRATDQWFVSMDKNGLRADALKAIFEEVEFIPDWAKNRIGSMVEGRPDWCISRQRSWGVPIPVFKCGACGETIATAETFDAVIRLFETEGADAWFIRSPKEYLPAGTCCPKCGSDDILPEKDILDVWWESGVSHTSVCRHRSCDGLRFPADMYLEGSDQHRGWFQSALLTSEGAYHVPPYKSVMHCGFTVDEQGRKMSKSLGNGVDPAEVMEKYGADVLRLWVSSVDYSQDVSISDNILRQVSDAYRRFRNTFRFLLGNLNDFDDRTDCVKDFAALEPIDQYMMVRTANVLDEITAAYAEYRYNTVYRVAYDFVNDLSAVYMDVAKDRLYAEAPNSPRRRAVQTVLMNILDVLVRVLCPILSFTCEEVYDHFPPAMRERNEESVQLAGWPTRGGMVPALPDEGRCEEILAAFSVALEVRESVTKALEEARTAKFINKSQEAQVEVQLPAEMLGAAKGFDPAVFEELFIVSSVAFKEGKELEVRIGLAQGEKCPRCWNIRVLGGNEHHPDVCERCGDVLDEIGFSEA